MNQQFNVRLDPLTLQYIYGLRKCLAVRPCDVIKLAVRLLAKREGVAGRFPVVENSEK